jgi:hypothetical protein
MGSLMDAITLDVQLSKNSKSTDLRQLELTMLTLLIFFSFSTDRFPNCKLARGVARESGSQKQPKWTSNLEREKQASSNCGTLGSSDVKIKS